MTHSTRFAVRSLFIFTVLGSLAIAAAGQGLGDGTWRLTELNGKAISGSKAKISFDDRGKSVSGNAGCNRLSGTFVLIQKRIKFSGIVTTKMACADRTSNEIENGLLAAFSKVDAFSIRSQALTLWAKRKVLIRLEKISEDIKPSSAGHEFDGNKWMLNAIRGVELNRQSRSAFVVFNAERGSASGNSDCNAFGGTFRSDGDTIGVSDLMSTMRACFEDGTMDVERSLINGLQSANRYQVVSGMLELYDDSQLLLTFQRN